MMMIISKKHSDVIKAWLDGNDVQYRSHTNEEPWIDIEHPPFSGSVEYRVKPKEKVKKLVPFDSSDAEFLIGKTVKRHIAHKDEKGFCCLFLITAILDYGDKRVILGGINSNSFSHFLDVFTFADGSPCGKYIEE